MLSFYKESRFGVHRRERTYVKCPFLQSKEGCYAAFLTVRALPVGSLLRLRRAQVMTSPANQRLVLPVGCVGVGKVGCVMTFWQTVKSDKCMYSAMSLLVHKRSCTGTWF